MLFRSGVLGEQPSVKHRSANRGAAEFDNGQTVVHVSHKAVPASSAKVDVIADDNGQFADDSRGGGGCI